MKAAGEMGSRYERAGAPNLTRVGPTELKFGRATYVLLGMGRPIHVGLCVYHTVILPQKGNMDDSPRAANGVDANPHEFSLIVLARFRRAPGCP